MGRVTIEQAIEYWKIFLDEIEELKTTPGTEPEEWDEQEKATIAALEALVKQRHYEDLEEAGRLIEQKHGQWIANKHMVKSPTAENYHCSECTQAGKRTSYCPHCGAKMSSEPSHEEKRAMTEEAFDILAKMEEVE